MRFSRYYESENINDRSDIASSFDEYLNKSLAYNNHSNLNTVEGMLEDLSKRTGLNQYITQINAEIEKSKFAEDKNNDGEQDSLLDIKEVKEAIDEALSSNRYSSSVDLLKKLEDQIKFNKNIPDYLKSVFSDKKLKEYIDSNIKNNKDECKIDLLFEDNSNTQLQEHEPYFTFNHNETQK